MCKQILYFAVYIRCGIAPWGLITLVVAYYCSSSLLLYVVVAYYWMSLAWRC